MKKQKKPRIVGFAIITTITILTWVAFDVWRTFKQPVPTKVDQAILATFTPTLDKNEISEIKNRTFFSDEEVRSLVITGPNITSPSFHPAVPVPTQSATNSASLSVQTP